MTNYYHRIARTMESKLDACEARIQKIGHQLDSCSGPAEMQVLIDRLVVEQEEQTTLTKQYIHYTAWMETEGR